MNSLIDKTREEEIKDALRVKKGEEGFTLIELLLVIAILGIVGLAVFNTYFNSWQSWVSNRNKVNIQQAHRAVVTRISPFIREADLVKVSTGGDRLRVGFKEKDPAGSPYNLLEMGVISNKFYLQKGYTDGVTINWQEPVVIAGSESLMVTEPSFTYRENKKIVVVKLTLKPLGHGGNILEDYRFRDSFYLRNEDIMIDF